MSPETPGNTPPISQPCFTYYREAHTLLDFALFTVSLVTERDNEAIRVAKRIQELSRRYQELTEDEEDRKRIEGNIAKYEQMAREGVGAKRHFKEYGQLFWQMIHCKVADTYLAYISELLALVFTTRPEILSGKQVSVDSVLKARSTEELISALAEREVNELSYQGMKDLAKSLETRLGFELFTAEGQLLRAVAGIELRNLIVHNRGKISRRFLDRVPSYVGVVGDSVDLKDALPDWIEFFLNSVADIDKRAGEKFGIPQSALGVSAQTVLAGLVPREAGADVPR